VTEGRRRPLDRVLVERGYAPDLAAAHELVAAGRVLVDGAPSFSAARAVAAGEQVLLIEERPFVGRGARKLAGALERCQLDVGGRLALDVGASTGGFTDCLLAHGAARVLAVDVGRGQLHERLAADPRVVSMERTNVRDLEPAAVERALGAPPSIVTVDVSFTSVAPHAARIVSLAAADASLLVLVKPQFEVDRATASRGRGVVTDPEAWRAVLRRCASAFEEAGAGIMGAVASTILGASGNVEFFLHARVSHSSAPWRDRRLDDAVDEAPAR
jgi:23S rRNA (cytidine1920-2'-O)/16S rRNA (cytidine1409-2'-O)-methyltransferase